MPDVDDRDVLDLSGDTAAPRPVPVTISATAAYTAAQLGVARYYRMRLEGRSELMRAPRRFDRCWYDQIVGALAEMALAVHLGVRWCPTLGPDDGTGDVAGWQVKGVVWHLFGSIVATGPHLIIPGHETTPRPYVLVYGNGFTDWQIAGWLPAALARVDDWQAYEQSRKAWWVPMRVLRQWPPELGATA